MMTTPVRPSLKVLDRQILYTQRALFNFQVLSTKDDKYSICTVYRLSCAVPEDA
jgi:hypothetical protein